MSDFNVYEVRKDFPGLAQQVHGQPLIYFDNAATAQKPQCVIDEVSNYYQKYTSNINRGAHYLSDIATQKYCEARSTIARFINASDASNIVFTRGTTEAINLVAHSLGRCHLSPGDEIILTEMEHHANIVPWYLIAKDYQLKLRVAPVLDNGELDIISFKKLFSSRTKLAAFTHVSNTLGTINPVSDLIAIAKSFGVPTLIDGAQALHHVPIDVKALDVDFYAFSSHKAYGPSGIGALYALKHWLESFPPYQGGGDMIAQLSFENISFAQSPKKFEAGTPNIEGALGFARALTYLESIGLAKIYAYEHELSRYMHEQIAKLKHVKLIGQAHHKVSLISFTIEGVHPHDASSIFDRQGIAIRAGHLCTQPIMKRFGVSALSRASLAFYNTHEEVDQFIAAFEQIFKVFKL